MKNKSVKAQLEEYESKYGSIPLDHHEILQYLRDNMNLNINKINEEITRIDSIPWRELDIIIPIVPRPSPRPRYNFKTQHFYVMGAATNKRLIQSFIDKYSIIYTQTRLLVQTYQPTPLSSMTNTEIYLAECKKVRPVQDPDECPCLENTHLIAGT